MKIAKGYTDTAYEDVSAAIIMFIKQDTARGAPDVDVIYDLLVAAKGNIENAMAELEQYLSDVV